jgi:formiminotetrahydrofolate cyclodeaminase
MLADQSLRQLLAAFASPAPTPAGGSASALASAVGVSLLMMAASVARSRTGSDAEREALAVARDALIPLQRELTASVDLDHEAYRQLVSTRKVSRTSPVSDAEADEARQRALQRATDVPLEVMRMSCLAMQQAPTVAAHCHRPASSDVRVAIALIRAGFAGARSSAQDNLARMTHGEYVEGAHADIDQLQLQADQAADAAEQASRA